MVQSAETGACKAPDIETVSETLQIRTAELGLSRFTDNHIENSFVDLSRTIAKSMLLDDGLPIVRSGLPFIEMNNWRPVPAGSRAIAIEVGGTNITVSEAVKTDNQTIALSQLERAEWPLGPKEYTHDQFTGILADITGNALLNHDRADVQNLALSLGFPHKNVRTDSGYDGQFETGDIAKGLRIIDLSAFPKDQRPLIGEQVKEQLSRLGINVEYIALVNDTIAIAEDISAKTASKRAIAPVSLVGGTGTNVAMRHSSGMINLEIAKQKIKHPDEVMKRVMELLEHDRIVEPGSDPITEYFTGMFIPYRVAATIELLHEEGLVLGEKGYSEDGLLLADTLRMLTTEQIGDLACGSLDAAGLLSIYQERVFREDEPEASVKVRVRILQRMLTPSMLNTLSYLANEAMYQSAQTYAVMACAAANISGAPRGDRIRAVPTEGSVVLKGKVRGGTVKDVVEQTCRFIGYPIEIIEASGAAGASALAMTEAYELQAALAEEQLEAIDIAPDPTFERPLLSS